MSIIEAFFISIQAIWSNKLRSILTMLGLIIGISSVVTIVSLGNATQTAIEEELSSLGINSIYIYHDRQETIKPSESLSIDDMKYVEKTFEDTVLYVTPNIEEYGTILSDIEETGLMLSASTLNTDEAEDLTLVEGRFLNEFDISGYKRHIVIDSDLAEILYGSTTAVGNKVLVTARKATSAYQIVGVYENKETLEGFSESRAYMPYTTMDMMFKLQGQIGGLKVTFDPSVEDINVEIQYIVTAIERYNRNIGEGKYVTFSAEDFIESVNETLGMLTLFVSAIAGISLVVGGIGVMNIMLVSVTERTKEIGIRKALGAQYTDIMLQFLIEAITISIIGGMIGSIFGGIFTHFGGKLMKMNAVMSMNSLLLAVVFSVSIGLFFGIYPANKAAKLDPIEALRHE